MSGARQLPFNTWDALKILGIAFMFVDHASAYFFNTDEQTYWLRAIGRGAAPIFLFLAGYAGHYRFNRQLFVLAVLLEAFDWVYSGKPNTLNILFSILLWRGVFDHYERQNRVIERPHEWFIGALPMFVASILVEYGSMGFLIALAGYLRRHANHYPKAQVWGTSTLCFLAYAAYEIVLPKPPIHGGIVAVLLAIEYVVLMRFPTRPCLTTVPALLSAALKHCSVFSGHIYVGHIILMRLVAGI